MKRYFMVVTLIILIVFGYFKLMPIIRDKMSTYKDKDGVSYISMVDNKYFYIYKYGKWQKEFIKGVNMGAAKPGSFPGDLAVTKEEYLKWFEYIGKMNANTIRVYTILKPAFYDALYEYNRKSAKPIYLMQGVWINEDDIANLKNAYNPKIIDGFKSDIKKTIDVLHGKAVISPEPGNASGIYTKDISPYVNGWILGLEWDPNFVQETNNKNQQKTVYTGKYLYSETASPFEAWLAQMGDYAIQYESEKYNMQRPLSFVNWPTTDVLKHPNEPLEQEDMVAINPNHIRAKADFKPGLFASYHIYPYYPDFMNYEKEYTSFKDSNGKVNTYEAYLKDLIKEHTMPVLVAEFGVPSSRGMTHQNIYTGFNQGDIDEKTQGEMDTSMLQDIYKEGYAGGLVFTWQDEWFKRTWNTMDFDLPDRRAYWSNPQTCEQEFGLLAFDPGEKKSTVYVDGDISDWKNEKPLVTSDAMKLYVKSDEKYIYLRANVKDFDINKDKVIIPIDTIPGQGSSSIKDLGLNIPDGTDFVIVIDGKNNSRVLVDSYYDSFYYMYSNLKLVDKNPRYEVKNSGIFNPIYLCLNRGLYLPQDKKTIPFSKYETGKLFYGDGNPSDKDYNSLSDLNINGENIEIRIPWQLLNIMDPSSKQAIGNLYENGIKPIDIGDINFGTVVLKDGKVISSKNVGSYSWKKWNMPTYHERLKPSYYILEEAFKEIGG